MIDNSAKVIDSIISDSAKIYRNTIVRKSSIGKNCIIGDMSRVEDSVLNDFSQVYPMGTVYSSSIGAYSYAQKNCSIWHSTIGKYCSLSWNVSIGGGEHDFHKVTAHSMLYAKSYGFIETPLYDRFSKQCTIGNDVWIASGASVLRGVTIGDGAVIGAGAVVTKNVDPYSIVAGVPAKIIGQRCPDDIIEDLLTLCWWNWPEEIIKENISLFNCELNSETILSLKLLKDKYQV